MKGIKMIKTIVSRGRARVIAVSIFVLLFISLLSLNSYADDGQDLIDAAKREDISSVKVLLEKGAEVNAKNKSGETALMLASQYGYSEIVKMLLDKGAEVTEKDEVGLTAMMLASMNGHTKIVKDLLGKGADMNTKNKRGATALMLASQYGYSEIVKMLLDKSADVNLKNNDGETAFILASRRNHTETVKLLLAKGADVDKSRSLTMIEPKETFLSDYREKAGGMFSNMWAVYILSEGEGEQKERFIELNGKKIGPFKNTSDLISFSPNGKQVVFAAKEKTNNKWSVYVNGEKRWSYDGLAWATYTWPMGLKDNIIASQVKAVVFKQSHDNKLVSFFTYRKEGDKTLWANVSNGKLGRYYKDTNTTIYFINGEASYWAWKSDDTKYFVVGNIEYGPYDNAKGIKLSDDKKHFAFVAESGGKNILILDGKEILIPGEIEGHVLGNDGTYAVAYKQNGSVYVLQNGAKWPKNYSETVWHQFRMTPDGKRLAGWFKRDGKWYVVVNGVTEYGPYESYYYIEAGESYSLFLGKSAENVGYFSRVLEGNSMDAEFHLNGKRVENGPNFGGIISAMYQDDSGQIVGVGRMGGVEADMMAVADAVAVGADNPLEAMYFGAQLVYAKKKGDLTYVVADQKEFGPYVNAGSFCSSPSGKHYAYIAENQNGKWIVVDGKYQSPYYESIYKLQFAEENEVGFLTVKDGKVVRVSSTMK